MIKFVENHIIIRFGIPRVLISNNGTQFVGAKFTKYLSKHGIKHKKASVCHPRQTAKWRLQTESLYGESKSALAPPSDGGRKNFVMYYGHIVPHPEKALAKLHSN